MRGEDCRGEGACKQLARNLPNGSYGGDLGVRGRRRGLAAARSARSPAATLRQHLRRPLLGGRPHREAGRMGGCDSALRVSVIRKRVRGGEWACGARLAAACVRYQRGRPSSASSTEEGDGRNREAKEDTTRAQVRCSNSMRRGGSAHRAHEHAWSSRQEAAKASARSGASSRVARHVTCPTACCVAMQCSSHSSQSSGESRPCACTARSNTA